MADGTKIEWADATANCINGCSLESPGCRLCYAMKQAHRTAVRRGLTRPSKGGMVWTGEVRFHEPALLQVLRWQRPRQIFWNAHGDTFHPKVPDAWIDRCFAAVALTPQHRHLVLTKRSARMRSYMREPGVHTRILFAAAELTGKDVVVSAESRWPWPLPNAWLGVSVEDRPRWDDRVPDLRATPAAVRWISGEPLLGPLGEVDMSCIDWIVVGGESGARAKPMHPDWARSLRDQCQAASVPFFFKHWGEWAPCESENGTARAGELPMMKVGKKAAGRLLDGVEHSACPERGRGGMPVLSAVEGPAS